ncbi:hypothetical protein GF324_00775, partial [bacterium]|nr:hypothetical protein [bacterium]
MMKRTLAMTVAVLCLVGLTFVPVLAETSDDLVPAYTPSQSLDDSPVDLPNVQKKTLKNGLSVYYVPQSELPTVTVRLLVLSGSLY